MLLANPPFVTGPRAPPDKEPLEIEDARTGQTPHRL
jgi:hypothetical protein